MSASPRWTEIYEGGSPDAERRIFLAMAADMLPAPGTDHALRMMFAKTVAGTAAASLAIDRLLPCDLAVPPFRPGAVFPATIRFSNASSLTQIDSAPDMRGLSIRLALPGGDIHDLLLANFPTALARDARQFYEFAMGSIGDRETLLARLAARIGVTEARRIATYLKTSLKLCPSLAREHYWSGCAFLWGDSPVRIALRPIASARDPIEPGPFGADMLRLELARRLAAGEVGYRLAVQRYVDEETTPIEDAARDWPQRASPPVEIGSLVIHRQDILDDKGRVAMAAVDRLAFDAWNTPAAFRPLGSLNRLRRILYERLHAADRAS